jgi:hypothetical protein
MLRWPIIRHIRWFVLMWRFQRWMSVWAKLGYPIPQRSDLEYLDRVWKGEE